jgi:hypothetical protein
MPRAPRPPGTVRPTGWQAVGVAVVVGAGLGWSLFALLNKFGAELPRLPLAVTLAIAVLAAAVGTQAFVAHRTIQVRRQPMAPGRAVALLVLGKSCLLGGAGLAGGYGAVAAHFWTRLDASVPRDIVVSSAAAVVASAALAVAGAFLERSCRIPGPPDEDATPSDVPGSTDSPD